MASALQLPADSSEPRIKARISDRQLLASCSGEAVNDLEDIYDRLATRWTHEQLAAHYRTADRRGRELVALGEPELARPIGVLAAAIPPSTTASTAIHLLHSLPSSPGSHLPGELLDTAERNTAAALHRAERALELDGAAHGYTVDEWIPVVFDIAGPVMQGARLDADPPTLVREAQQVISWLSRALVELDQDSTEIPSALAELLARYLVTWVFAALAREDSPAG